MKITNITATVRFSKALGDGKHKTLEVGAEATIEPREKWQDAQATLYRDLAAQIRTLWAQNGQPK